ncbi:uncharacterized protein LOC144593157 isoform X1 [Rhinoraja longicauda]
MESTDRETENGYKCVNEMQTGGTHINFAEQNKLHELNIGFAEDSDAEGSLMKDKNLSLDKRSSGSTGDQMINIPKKDKLKKEQWEDDAQVTEHSQIQQQHDVVEKQFDHVKALLQANQLLTEGLRTKLLQIWCNVRKNQVRESLKNFYSLHPHLSK